MNLMDRMMQRMLLRMNRRLAKDLQEEMEKSLKEMQESLMQGTLDPAKIAEFARSMGIDMSWMSDMMKQAPGFDPYRILGLDRSASDEEVKERYRELLRHEHPDTAGAQGTDFLLQMVVMAYEMIKRERGWQ